MAERTLPPALLDIAPDAGDARADSARADAPVDSGDDAQARFAALIVRMAQGDEAALGTLFDATAGRVNGLALRICGSPALAEEVTADTFYQAWTDAIRYDASRGRVLTWLLVIARSRALDALRARDRAFLHDSPETLIDADESHRAPAVDELVELVETNTALRAHLDRLTPIQRQVIALAYYRGLSHSEIAEHTGLALGTVKAHTRRALASLRDAVGPQVKG